MNYPPTSFDTRYRTNPRRILVKQIGGQEYYTDLGWVQMVSPDVQ